MALRRAVEAALRSGSSHSSQGGNPEVPREGSEELEWKTRRSRVDPKLGALGFEESYAVVLCHDNRKAAYRALEEEAVASFEAKPPPAVRLCPESALPG